MRRVSIEKVELYRVQTKQGPLLMECVSRWNGMLELRDEKGQALIIDWDRTDLAFSQVFNEAFGHISHKKAARHSALVVRASPDLAAELADDDKSLKD